MAEEKNYMALALALLSTAFISACSTKLEEIEEEGITYIYEVEKMARDVYKYFYDTWGTYIMDTISHGEQAHMNIVKELVENYDLDNPTEGNDYGEFTNSELQQLYHNLIEEGSSSESDALAVAALIEEIDIIDVNKYMEQTEKDDIDKAYSRLNEGSSDHLRIFVSALRAKGLEYHPTYLSQDVYNQIITTKTATTTSTTNEATFYYCHTPGCGYIYDPAVGDPDGGIAPGTPFEDIPDDWRCPVCGATKASFKDYPL